MGLQRLKMSSCMRAYFDVLVGNYTGMFACQCVNVNVWFSCVCSFVRIHSFLSFGNLCLLRNPVTE